MNINRNIGIMLISGGVIIVAMCLNAAVSIADRMDNVFTGLFTETTFWFLIIGTAYTIAGSLFVILSGDKAIAR